VDGYWTDAKMNPPLRTEEDRLAVVEGFLDGTLDTLATDHAPHHYDEKEQAFDDAPFGIIGLETALGLVHGKLVVTGALDLTTMVERMSTAPARAFHLPGGTLAQDSPADVTVFDPAARWTVDAKRFLSKSRNTPFGGWELTGRATLTVVGGSVVWEDGAR
jgi:dihydroorotase